ncbi:MAG TPA: Slp family lipoprotein, partial [Nitrospira sp.]
SIRMLCQSRQALLTGLALVLAGCSSSRLGIPEALALQIDKAMTFAEVVASPDSFKGKLMIVGGQLLKAKRVKEGTQIEFLQLPLNEDDEPTTVLTQSKGRFIAIHQEGVDPATLTSGMMVTLVGEVTGSMTDKLDEVDYRYPIYTVKHWHVWPPETFHDRHGSSSIGVFGGFGIGGGGSRGGGGIGIGF